MLLCYQKMLFQGSVFTSVLRLSAKRQSWHLCCIRVAGSLEGTYKDLLIEHIEHHCTHHLTPVLYFSKALQDLALSQDEIKREVVWIKS